MKKRALLILIFSILILNIFVISINAQDDIPDVGIPVEKISDIGEKISNQDVNASDYLKQEWGKILEKQEFFGPLLRVIKGLDPFSEFLLRIPITLSWLFFLTLIIWIAMLIYIYRLLDLVTIFSKPVFLIMYVGIAVVVSIFGIAKNISEYIINAISILAIWWVQLIAVVAVIVGIIVASIFSKEVKNYIENFKKQLTEEKRKLREQELDIKLKAIDEMRFD